MHGFTCGVDDLIIIPSAEAGRKKVLDSCQRKSEKTHLYFVDANSDEIGILISYDSSSQKFLFIFILSNRYCLFHKTKQRGLET